MREECVSCRQHIIEEKVEEMEQQLELSREALESILMHLQTVDEFILSLLENEHTVSQRPGVSVTQPFPGWEPIPTE